MLPSRPGLQALRERARSSASCAAGTAAPRRRPRRAAARMRWSSYTPLLDREPQQLLDELGVDRRAGGGSRPARASASSSRRCQPSCSAPIELVVGDEHVGEEHLVEVGLVGDLAQRPHLDAGRAHVDDEVRDPLVASATSGLVRARQHPPVGELRVARPHLLAVEQPAAVGPRRRAWSQRREVAAGARLAEQLAPDLLGASRIFGSQRGFCSVVPCASSVGPTRFTPMRPTSSGARARASSSVTM